MRLSRYFQKNIQQFIYLFLYLFMGDERHFKEEHVGNFEEVFLKFSEKKIQNVLGYW